MANLSDNIRLTTEVDLNALSNAIKEYKVLGITVNGVAVASRLVMKQLKEDAAESAILTKQKTDNTKLETLEIKKKGEAEKLVGIQLSELDKLEQTIADTSAKKSRAKIANIQLERTERRNLIEDLTKEDLVKQNINATDISNSNKKIAASKAEIAAGNELIKGEKLLQELEKTSTAQKNTETTAIRQKTAANQQSASAIRVNITETKAQKEIVRLNTEQQRLYNAQLRNKALESANAEKASRNLGESLNVLTGLRSQLIGLFGIMSIGSFAKDMIDAQSTVQSFGLSMKNLLGNAYGEKLLNDLKVFTVNTPLDFQQVIKSTNQLVGSFKAAGASSKEIGIEVPKILESIGNSAAALGGDDRMGRLIYAFSQVQATGRLMGTEVRQITETGFPMLAVLTQSLNERFPKLALSVSDVQKRISDGKVSFDDFKIAMLSAGQAGGVFAGGMEARMTTVAGSLDKLKESTFFALANIGNQFNDTAKMAIDFGSSIIKTFFGTNEAAQRSVEIVSNLTKIYLGYRAALALVATTTLLKDAYDKASLITQGLLMRSKALLNGESQKFITLMAEETLAKTVNTGATVGTTAAIEVMTVAEAKAAIATRSLSAAFGVIAIVLGVAYAAYEIYKSTVAEADEKQKEFNERISLGVAPIREAQSEFNRLANALKNSSDATQEKNTKLEALKTKFPEQLKGINDLATAEKLLGDKANDTNIVKEYRLKLFNQLKAKFPEQTKGLNDVNFSESELAKVMKEVNGDFLIRQQLMKDEIKLNMNKEKINIWLKEQIELEGKLAKASNKSTFMVTGTAGNIQEIASERSEIEKAIAARSRWVLNGQQANAKIVENSIETTKKLKFNWDEQTKDANGTGKKQGEDADKNGKDKMEKALKYQADTAKQTAILSQANSLREQQQTRESEKKILDLEKEYDELRVANAKGSKSKKVTELLAIEKKYNEDSANLTRVWDKKDLEASEKFWKEVQKAEKESQDERVKFSQGIDKVLENAKESSEKKKTKIAEDYAKENRKLEEDNAKESKKLSEGRYELLNNLRILDKVSQAKSSKDLIEIENEEKRKILESNVKSYETKIALATAHVARMKNLYGEDSVEYKQAVNNMLVIQQDFTNASIDLAKFRTEKVKDSIEKEAEAFKQILLVVTDITSQMFDAVDKQTDERLSKSTSAIEKNLLNNIKNETAMAKEGLSAIVSLASGDVAGAVTKGISLLFKAIDDAMNRSANHAKAVMQEQQEMIIRYANKSRSEIENIVNQISSLSDIYKPIQLVTLSLEEQAKLLDEYVDKLGQRGFDSTVLINKEIEYGQLVQSNYEKNVDNEKDIFDRKIQNIDSVYDAEVKRIGDAYELQIDGINKRYDYEELRANQKYNTETLGIVAAGTAQLEALITNEESLASVRAEFATKRIQIEEAFPLAAKQITSDMSQAEVDAINASIEARDEAFAQLQERYNAELITIAEAEGQKRKEYTATEKIQNEIQERLELAAIKFDGEQIIREQAKQQAIIDAGIARDAAELVALDLKNQRIEAATLLLNENLLFLENQKNAALLESFKRLQQGIEVEINRVSGLLSAINDKASQEYKDLQEQLGALVNKYKELVGINPTITITDNTNTPSRQPRGFEKGTDNTSVSLTGATVDSRGGKMAILHPEEAVFSKADMTQMTRFLGKRPTRDEVINRFKMGTKLIDSNSFIQKISPYVINKSENNNNTDVRDLTKKIERLTKEVVKRQQPMVTVDKNGIRTYVTNINSQIEIKNQKFSS